MSKTKPIVLTAIFIVGHIFGCHASSESKTSSANHSENVILEIYTESKYDVYPPGKVLNLKLYDSGRAEYDYYPSQEKRVEYYLKRKEVILSKDDFNNLKQVLADKSLAYAKAEYPPSVPILDASIRTTVIFKPDGQTKTTVLNENHSNLILEKKGGKYPRGLLDLLIFVQNLNRQWLEQKPDEDSAK